MKQIFPILKRLGQVDKNNFYIRIPNRENDTKCLTCKHYFKSPLNIINFCPACGCRFIGQKDHRISKKTRQGKRYPIPYKKPLSFMLTYTYQYKVYKDKFGGKVYEMGKPWHDGPLETFYRLYPFGHQKKILLKNIKELLDTISVISVQLYICDGNKQKLVKRYIKRKENL